MCVNRTMSLVRNISYRHFDQKLVRGWISVSYKNRGNLTAPQQLDRSYWSQETNRRGRHHSFVCSFAHSVENSCVYIPLGIKQVEEKEAMDSFQSKSPPLTYVIYLLEESMAPKAAANFAESLLGYKVLNCIVRQQWEHKSISLSLITASSNFTKNQDCSLKNRS